VGWQPSRFLSDRGEAERAFQLAEQLGSVNAAAAELGTTWPSRRKAFARHGLGMPARNPRRSASGRSPPPAGAAAGRPPSLDPVFEQREPRRHPTTRAWATIRPGRPQVSAGRLTRQPA
jgi:hypothetical protein